MKKPLALEPLVRESTRLILQDANVPYRLNWPEPLPQVNADAEQLHQLLYELLTNAMHATPIGGSIHVRGESVHLDADSTLPLPEGDYVRLSVRDEGMGIPEPHLTRIFEPFFTTKENARGLGLATCFLIARNHDGFMTVDSAPGFGTTFYLYLPALPAGRHPLAPPLERPMSMRLPPETRGHSVATRTRPSPVPPGSRRHAARARDGRRGADLRTGGGTAQPRGVFRRHGGRRRGGDPQVCRGARERPAVRRGDPRPDRARRHGRAGNGAPVAGDRPGTCAPSCRAAIRRTR